MTQRQMTEIVRHALINIRKSQDNINHRIVLYESRPFPTDTDREQLTQLERHNDFLIQLERACLVYLNKDDEHLLTFS